MSTCILLLPLGLFPLSLSRVLCLFVSLSLDFRNVACPQGDGPHDFASACVSRDRGLSLWGALLLRTQAHVRAHTHPHTHTLTPSHGHTHKQQAAEELASSLGFKMDLKLPPMHRIDLPAMPAAPLPRPTSANTDQPPASADKQPSSTADTSPSAVCTGAHTTPHANSGNEAVRPADVDRADGSGEVGPSPLPTSWPPAPSDTSSAAEWALVGADMGMGRRRARCESMEIANERMGDMHRQLVQLQSERRNDSRHEARQEPPHHAAEGTVPCQSEPRVPLLPLSPATSHHDHHPHEHTPSSPGVRHVSVLHVGAMRQAMAAEDLAHSSLRRYNVPLGRCLG